jgi:hypothetical protein
MHGGRDRLRAVCASLAGILVMLVVVGCSASEAEPGPRVPTFPNSATTSTTAGGAIDDGKVPDDCARLFPDAALGAWMGMPLGTVAVRTTIGVPAPSVGRIERVDCEYTGLAGGPARGKMLLKLNVGAYTDPDAAYKQWRTNADNEDGAHREFPIGAASAVLVERRGEALLMVVYGSGTLTVMLPDRPLPGGRQRADAVVDIALRVLPAMAETAPPPSSPARPPGSS